MLDGLTTDYKTLVLQLTVVVILLCAVILHWIVLRLRKSNTVLQPKKELESKKSNSPLEARFAKNLKKQHLLLENRLTAWNRAARSYRPGAGGAFDFHALEKPLRPAMLFDTRELVEEYHSIFAHQQAPKIAAALMTINQDFAEISTRTRIVGQNFRNQYDYATQLFGFYVFQLTQLNDQLAQNVKIKRLNPELLSFAASYTEIFDQWTASGIEKSIQELHRDLVTRIISLNEQYPRNSLYNRIAEYTSKSEEAYDIIEGLDRKIKELDRDGRIVITKALRVIRCLSGSHPFRMPASLSINPMSSFTPQVTHPTGAQAAKPVNFSDWVKNTLEQPNPGPQHSPNKSAPTTTNNPPSESAAGADKGLKAHRHTWIMLGALLVLLFVAGYCWMQYQSQNQPSNAGGHYAGISHPPVDTAHRIHTFNDHHTLLKPQLDSVHLASKIDSLKRVLSHPDRDSTEILTIAGHIDSLKRGYYPADLPNLMYGIDVSVYQGQVDWNRVAVDSSGPNPIHFTILRATHGLNIDSQFKRNWSSSREHIPVVGAYHFLSFQHDPIQQANLFVQTVPLGPGNIRPILDVETNCKDCNPTMGLTKAELIQHIQDYLRVVESHYDTKVIIYSNVHYYNTYLKGHFTEHDFWLAEYRGEQGIKKVIQSHQNPPDREIAVMWQFSSTGKILGINPRHNVDLSFLKGTYAERIKIGASTMESRE